MRAQPEQLFRGLMLPLFIVDERVDDILCFIQSEQQSAGAQSLDETAAAIVIQSAWRALQVRVAYTRLKWGATYIQKMMRSHLARVKFQSMWAAIHTQQRVLFFDYAAARIQAAARGWATRKYILSMRERKATLEELSQTTQFMAEQIRNSIAEDQAEKERKAAEPRPIAPPLMSTRRTSLPPLVAKKLGRGGPGETMSRTLHAIPE